MKLVSETNEKLKEHLTTKGKSKETRRGYYQNIKMFDCYLTKKYNVPVYVDEVDIEDIEQYMHMLKTEKDYQPASVNRHLNAIRAMFRFAMRKGWVTKNPTVGIDQLKVNQKEPDFLTEDEISMLLETIEHEIGNVVARTLAYTGLRISECLNLTIQDVDFDKNIIHVINGKGGKDRDVPMAESLKPYLKDYLDNVRPNTTSNYFFATKKTGSFSPVYMNKILKEAVEKLEWEKKVTCHTLRHSFASILVNDRGVTLSQVANLLGHADFRTVTSIYVHSTQEQLASAVNQL